MFQYAAGLFYAQQCNADLQMVIDPPDRAQSYGHPRPFLLSHFAITAKYREMNKVEKYLLLNEHRRLKPAAKRLLQDHIFQRGLRIQIVSESLQQRFRFQANLPFDHKMMAVYLLGYWQVHNIAEEISLRLRSEFTFRTSPTGKNSHWLREILGTPDSVSLHIRRGDYTLAAEGNVALSVEYYARAIAHVRSTLGNPTFFIFSDDIEFAKANIGRDIACFFIDHNDAFSAHEDLRLMSACRHHIIANSTFSWWGAWLNPLKGKIVIAPRHWLVAHCPTDNDLFPGDWILLE